MEIHTFAARVATEICELPAEQQTQVIDLITNKVVENQEKQIEEQIKKLTEKKSALAALKSKLAR